MGKEEKEDTGFGFKDRAKAEETLRLLEAHDPGYRRLTVRGLLGRAKRVLSLTKAEDKIKNIKEAMEVFEDWLKDLEKPGTPSKAKPKEKKKASSSEDEEIEEVDAPKKGKKEDDSKNGSQAPDTVPGLGFKDEAKAQETLQLLAGRDPDYQKLAVKGLLGRAKRVLTCTRDEEKCRNIKEAMSTFDKFIEDFERQNLGKQNNPYVSLAVVRHCVALADERELALDEAATRFQEAYDKVGGEYKKLRTVTAEKDGGITWDIVRNNALKELKEKYKDVTLFKDSGEPTDDHIRLIQWAYSPDEYRTKRLVSSETKKRRSSGDQDVKAESKKTKATSDD